MVCVLTDGVFCDVYDPMYLQNALMFNAIFDMFIIVPFFLQEDVVM